MKMKKLFKEEKLNIKKNLITLKKMVQHNISQELRLKNIDETRNYFIEEIKQNEFMSEKHKNVCTLNYIEQHFLTLASTIAECKDVSIPAFASFLGVTIGITSSAIGLKICAITARIKKYK